MSIQIKTLGDALPEEIKRCQALLADYAALGPVGAFGHEMIDQQISKAVNALADGDCVAMLLAYEALKECK